MPVRNLESMTFVSCSLPVSLKTVGDFLFFRPCSRVTGWAGRPLVRRDKEVAGIAY